MVELYSYVKTEVFCDERAIVRMALDHFEEHCFENVGFFSIGQTRWIIERERHFKEEAIARGFSPYLFIDKFARKDPTWYPLWNEKYKPGLRAWLEKLPKPIAVFTANDHQAAHLINVCNELGYRIPEEIAVLGVNNDTLLCDILSPTLSSIDQNAHEVGYEAARLLDMKMNGKDSAGYEKGLLPVSVVTRESTDIYALKNPDVNRALHFIRGFATTGIRVTDVLNEVNLTSRTLERYFKESLGHCRMASGHFKPYEPPDCRTFRFLERPLFLLYVQEGKGNDPPAVPPPEQAFRRNRLGQLRRRALKASVSE